MSTLRAIRPDGADAPSRMKAMTAAGSEVAIGITRTTAPPADEREYTVPLGGITVRWTDTGLEARAPSRRTLLGTRFRLRLEQDDDGPDPRGTSTNASPLVVLALLGVTAAWVIVDLVGALRDGSVARILTTGLVLAVCVVGAAVLGTARSTRHARTLALYSLATAVWEHEPRGVRRRGPGRPRRRR